MSRLKIDLHLGGRRQLALVYLGGRRRAEQRTPRGPSSDQSPPAPPKLHAGAAAASAELSPRLPGHTLLVAFITHHVSRFTHPASRRIGSLLACVHPNTATGHPHSTHARRCGIPTTSRRPCGDSSYGRCCRYRHGPEATLGPWTCAWHLRQRLRSRWISSLALMLPCGLWQAVQPSRSAGCSKTKGRVCSRWHWAQVSFRRAIARPAGRFEDVVAMRIVALHAVHLLLQHRVVLGKLEFRLLLAMALETSRRVFAGIDDELASPAAARDVQARRSVARFAARLPSRARVSSRWIRAWALVGKMRVMPLWHSAQVLLPTNVAPGMAGGANTVRRGGGTRIQQQSDGSRPHRGNHSWNDPPRFIPD